MAVWKVVKYYGKGCLGGVVDLVKKMKEVIFKKLNDEQKKIEEDLAKKIGIGIDKALTGLKEADVDKSQADIKKGVEEADNAS
ncbi:hypothetical protein SNOUR_01645 [Streptomyces noursei ATCC 11455]|nr:hypothetical protein SNOUR_01645 [Streptomyces noursei ATCC 11455]